MPAKHRYFSYHRALKAAFEEICYLCGDDDHSFANNVTRAVETFYYRYIEWRNLPPSDSYSYYDYDRDILDYWMYLVAPFQVFKDIGKDSVDTFKPYEGFYQIYRDAMQPIRGLVNFFKGIASIIIPALLFCAVSPFALLILSIILIASNQMEDISGVAFFCMIAPLSWMADGITSVIRGATQIAATPLAWIKMIVRGSLTAVNDGFAKIEEGPKIINEIKQAERELEDEKLYNDDSMKLIINTLHTELLKADYKGKSTEISIDEAKRKILFEESKEEDDHLLEKKMLERRILEEKIDHACEYLGIFPSFYSPLIRHMIPAWFLITCFGHRQRQELPQDVVNCIGEKYYLACRKR